MKIKEMLKEITGKSEKQISYAEDLRIERILSVCYDADRICKDDVDCEPRDQQITRLAILVSELAELIASGKMYTMTREEAATHRCLRDSGILKVLALLGMTEAREIIDFCKGTRCIDKDAIVVIAKEIVAINAAEEAVKAEAEATEEGDDNNATEETTEEATTTETKKTSYDKSAIMRSAWAKYKDKSNKKTFGECLKAAWAEAKKAAGVETTTAKRTAKTTEKTAKTTRRTNKTSTAVYVG